MRLSKALKEKMTDVRLCDKFLAEGKLSHGQFEDSLKKLPDDSEKFIFLDQDQEDE